MQKTEFPQVGFKLADLCFFIPFTHIHTHTHILSFSLLSSLAAFREAPAMKWQVAEKKELGKEC